MSTTIYDYLLDDEGDYDDGVIPHIDWDRLYNEQPSIDFDTCYDNIMHVNLHANTPAGIRSELEFYAIEIDPEIGAHAAVNRLQQLGYDAEYGVADYIPCAVYRAPSGKGGSWVIYDKDWDGIWQTKRLRAFAKQHGHPFAD